ncbi:MAG TPA: IBR domain-containing protein [Candidatus Dependentiae bacterium]|nr:IBR domain-containing protein [Candidatus Dependentiae bacterium]HRQ63146.1 IBR domain-containing protein [Candidatus Dependentiae bacterium]
MNKKTFMYTLLAALIVAMPSAELQAVKRTPKRARIAKKSTAPAASKSAQTSSNQTTDEYTEQAIPEDFPGLIRTTPRWMQPQQNGEFPNEKTHSTVEATPNITEQNPSITQTWGKVLRFKWTSLNRQDAKNIGETFVVMAIGYGAYKLYAAYNATAPRFNGPAGVGPHNPQPPMPPAPRGPQPRFFDDSDSDDDHSFPHLAPQSGQPNNDPFSLSALRRDLAHDNVSHRGTLDDLIEESNARARHTLFGHNAAVDQQTQTLHDLLDQEEQYRSHGQVVPAWLTKSIREIFKDSTQDMEPSLLYESSDSDEVGIPSPSQPSEPTPSNKYESESAPTHPVEAIECSVCMEDTEPADQIRLNCGHTYCIGCLTKGMDLGLKEQNTTYIQCPDPACNKRKLEIDEIRNILRNDTEKMDKYYSITLKEILDQDPNVKQCPTADCSNRYDISGQQPHAYTCPACKEKYCSHCLYNHSQNTTCEQAAELRSNTEDSAKTEKASADWIKQNTKPCPNCSKAIEKNDGCQHMTCRRDFGGCGHHFCWECLLDWDRAGHSFYNCPVARINQMIQSNNRAGLQSLLARLQQQLNTINTNTLWETPSAADRRHQLALHTHIQRINDALNSQPAPSPSPSVASPSPAALEAALQAARNAQTTIAFNTVASSPTLTNIIITTTNRHIAILQNESARQPYNTQITTALTTLRNIVAQVQAQHRSFR